MDYSVEPLVAFFFVSFHNLFLGFLVYTCLYQATMIVLANDHVLDDNYIVLKRLLLLGTP